LTLPQQYAGRTSLSETALQIMLFGGFCLLADSLALRGFRAAQQPAVGPAGTPDQPDLGLAPGEGGPADTVVLAEPIVAERRFTALLPAARRVASPGRWSPWLTPQRVLAALAGLSLGFGLLISLDAIIYLIPVIPFGCALVMGRRPQAAPFLAGSLVGVSYGLVGCYVLDRPFIDTVGQTVALAGVVAVWLIALCCVAFQLGRIGRVRAFVP